MLVFMIIILFLSANPEGTDKLDLINECNLINQKIRSSAGRELFKLEQRHDISIKWLIEELLNYNPQILHFSGHGSERSAIIFKNENTGQIEEVPPSVLSDLFKVLGKKIDLVFLNACYSEKQARAIAEHVNCVIGMSDAIYDTTAIEFASTFYLSLGFNKSVKEAFDIAIVQLGLLSLPGDAIPKLILKEGIDPSKIFMTANKLPIPMNNPDSSNTSTDKGFNVKNVGGHFTYTTVTGNSNTTNVSVSGDIQVNKQTLSKLDPPFGDSIEDFSKEINSKLKEQQGITEQQTQSISENIDKLAKELEGIKADQKIEDEDKKEDIQYKLRNLAEAIVDIAPDAARQIASMTPLAPISEAIGKGVGYVSDIIKRKLKK
jgi:hypothetical protein